MRSERSTRSSSITVGASCSCACILWADGPSPLHEFASDAREALYCLPALSLLLALGILSGHAGAALVAASGAFAVGFGSFQQFTRHKMAPMVLAAVGMTISAAAGSVLGRYATALVVAPAIWAALCGWAWSFGTGAWWIAAQWAIALLVAEAYPSGASGALLRASLIAAGGALQLAIVGAIWHQLAPERLAHDVRWRSYLRLSRHKMRMSRETALHALQAACAATLAVWLQRSLRLPNGYWAPMTVLLVLRPTLKETLGRGLARGAGTLIGAGLATLAVAALRPGTDLTAAFVVLFAWCSYALRRVHYAALSAAITACIVCLLALAGLPEPMNALHRIVATLIGATVAVAVSGLTRLAERVAQKMLAA